MKKTIIFSITGLSLLLLSSCSDPDDSTNKVQSAKGTTQAQAKPAPAKAKLEPVDRWYGFSQVSRGGKIFQENCASCHQKDASGTSNWKQTDEKGRYPAPPLNGSAHAWHHPMMVLRRTVKNGGVPLGGWMPPFKDKLNDQQIDDVLAWVQSHWDDEKYRIWHFRNEQAGQPIKKMN